MNGTIWCVVCGAKIEYSKLRSLDIFIYSNIKHLLSLRATHICDTCLKRVASEIRKTLNSILPNWVDG